MFNFVKGLTSAVVKTAVGVPVALAADVITMGGALTDKRGDGIYTGDMLRSAAKDLEDAMD